MITLTKVQRSFKPQFLAVYDILYIILATSTMLTGIGDEIYWPQLWGVQSEMTSGSKSSFTLLTNTVTNFFHFSIVGKLETAQFMSPMNLDSLLQNDELTK